MARPFLHRLFLVLVLLFEPELRALAGRAPLGRVFWIYGVLISSALALGFALAGEAGRTDLQQLLILLFLPYTAAILVAIWRCGEHAAPPWGTVARALTVAWACNTLLVVAMLQIDLLAAWLRDPPA
jgi:hypothetical protein